MPTKRIISSISLSPKINKELLRLMRKEEKSRSEIIRESLRLYFKHQNKKSNK